MPKRSPYIKGNSGFILPYVLFLATLMLLILTTTIKLYHNEVHITQMELESIKIETLLQMGYTSFTEEEKLNKHGGVQYEFPEGNVRIKYVKNKHSLRMYVTTDQQTYRSFLVPLNNQQKEDDNRSE